MQTLRGFRPPAGGHFVTLPAVVFAHGNQQPPQFRHYLFRKCAHPGNHFPCFRGRFHAKPLVCKVQQCFGVQRYPHCDGRILRGFRAVILVLSVITLTLDVRLEPNMMPHQMNGNPIGNIPDDIRKCQFPNRTMPCCQHPAQEIRRWRGLCFLAHCANSTLFEPT